MGDREILETYLNSASKNTSEADIFPNGTKPLLTSVICLWKKMMDNLKSALSATSVIIWLDFMFSDILHCFFCVVTETQELGCQTWGEMASSSALCFNLLKPNDTYICRTAALTSRRYILNIYSTNIHTEYFKRAA